MGAPPSTGRQPFHCFMQRPENPMAALLWQLHCSEFRCTACKGPSWLLNKYALRQSPGTQVSARAHCHGHSLACVKF